MDAPTVQPPNPYVTQPVLTPPPKKNSGIIIGILVFILGIFVGLLIDKTTILSSLHVPYLSAKPTSTPIPSPTVVLGAAGTQEGTANWKTYTSTKAKYSFKYPQEWPMINVPIGPGSTTSIEDLQFTPQYDPNSGDKVIAVILVFRDERIKTLEDYKNIFVKGDSSKIDIQDAVVGTEKAISYKLSGGIPPLPIIEYAVVNNDYYYTIRLEDSKETNKNLIENQTTFDQILSTFRFIETTPAPNQVGTITGKLCYPSDFLPQGEIVAKDTENGKLYTQNYAGSINGGSSAYSFQLPVGTYNVRYQAHASGNNKSLFISGYYTKCATNNSQDGCNAADGHALIKISVLPNQTIQGIDLCDFYYPAGGEPIF
jgi:hypothetical protein